jgi:hypothetical protein
MAFLWGAGLNIVGNNDPDVSPYLKAWVQQENTLVCGVIGEGTSKEITANWNSPFQDDSIGSKYSKVGAVIQGTTGLTSKSQLSSLQIWEGNQPHTFNLVLKFYALADAKAEVMDPLRELEKMITPEVNKILPSGRVPQSVWINIGRNALYGNCVITSMSIPLDKEKTKDGYLVRAETTLQVETKTMLNQSDINATYG